MRIIIKRHVTSEMHKQAANLALKKKFGPKRYAVNAHQNASIGKLITKTNQKARKVLKKGFPTAYYSAINEKPFSDYPKLLDLQELNGLEVQKGYQTDRGAAIFIDDIAEQMKVPLKECLLDAKYYSILQDGSTNTSVSEQELIYVIFLNDGRAIIKFLSIENPQAADAP